MAKAKKQDNKKQKITADVPVSKTDDSKVFALLSILLTIIGFVIVLLVRKDDDYARYYSKQGLVLFIGQVIALVFTVIPIVGQIIWILWVILWVIGIMYSLSGEKKAIPIVGAIADKISI